MSKHILIPISHRTTYTLLEPIGEVAVSANQIIDQLYLDSPKAIMRDQLTISLTPEITGEPSIHPIAMTASQAFTSKSKLIVTKPNSWYCSLTYALYKPFGILLICPSTEYPGSLWSKIHAKPCQEKIQGFKTQVNDLQNSFLKKLVSGLLSFSLRSCHLPDPGHRCHYSSWLFSCANTPLISTFKDLTALNITPHILTSAVHDKYHKDDSLCEKGGFFVTDYQNFSPETPQFFQWLFLAQGEAHAWGRLIVQSAIKNDHQHQQQAWRSLSVQWKTWIH